jgi:hypothetical protein
MFNDNICSRHHRGSSPPYQEQEPKRRLEDWMRSCRSIDQHPYNLSDIETLRQCKSPRFEIPVSGKSINDPILDDQTKARGDL